MKDLPCDSLCSTCTGQITQYSEFYVTSHNLEELLIADSYGEMLATLSEVYPMSLFSELQPAILTLIDPRERNFFAPEPPEKLGCVNKTVIIIQSYNRLVSLPELSYRLLLDSMWRWSCPQQRNKKPAWCRRTAQQLWTCHHSTSTSLPAMVSA